MAVISKNNVGVVSVGLTDTVLFNGSGGRYGVEAASLYNSSTSQAIVTIYSSSDNTSLSGSIVDYVLLEPNESLDITAIIGQGYDENRQLIAVSDIAGVNASLTYTLFTDGS